MEYNAILGDELIFFTYRIGEAKSRQPYLKQAHFPLLALLFLDLNNLSLSQNTDEKIQDFYEIFFLNTPNAVLQH